jgi:HSP20 family protein
MAQMQAEMDRFWNDRWPMVGLPRRLSELPGTWTPRTDIYEQDGTLIVKTDLPGVKRDEIAVEVEDGDLILHGERHDEQGVKEENFYRMERADGAFYRRLPLPEGTEPSKIEATYRDGVLEIHIPKPTVTHSRPVKISIK